MSALVRFMNLKIRDINLERIREILLENGFSGYDITPTDEMRFRGKHTTRTLVEMLEKTAEEFNFELPKRDFFTFFYTLGVGDGDSGYLYTPGFKIFIRHLYPNLEQIQNSSRDLSRELKFPILAVGELDKFAIPKLMCWEEGNLISFSRNAGEVEYTPNYFHDELIARFNN